MPLGSTQPHPLLVAFNRFGLGPRTAGYTVISRNPLGALIGELRRTAHLMPAGGALPTYAQACASSQGDFVDAYAVWQAEISARLDRQLSATVGFVERLVMFWSNHFSMSAIKAHTIMGTVGQLERDVIRTHVLGRFEDMLVGVVSHPAMIEYLDNDDSIGPRSPTGMALGLGLNENLAREILELHTVGSGGGYTEADVTAFARILTGWSFVRGWEADGGWNGGRAENRGQFIHRGDWQEPGTITLMGKRYADTGAARVREVLRDLAAHPKTAEHIAFKLVRHFITDHPTAAMVRPLAAAYLKSRGDLKVVAEALLRLPEAWTRPLTKFRTPYELLVAQYRALGTRHDADSYWLFWSILDAFRQYPFTWPTPDGIPDETGAWLSPDGMTLRLDTARLMALVHGVARVTTPAALARRLYGSAFGQVAHATVAGAQDRAQALTLLFMAPAFQRR